MRRRRPVHGDSCASAQGCVHAPNSKACNDGDICTGEDTCSGGKCTGKPLVCNDKKPCTIDYCHPVNGCVHDPKPLDGKSCAHPSGCVVGSFCNSGTCTGGDNSGCTNQGDCKLDDKSLFVTLGPKLPAGAFTNFAADGSSWSGSWDNGKREWLIVRQDSFGKVTAMVKTQEGNTATELRAVVPTDDGGALVGGGTNAQAAAHWQKWTTKLRRVDKDGKTMWTNKLGTSTGGVRDIARLKNGNWVSGAWPDGSGRASFMVFTDDGKGVVTRKYKGNSSVYYRDHWDLKTIVPEPGGGFYVAGRLVSPSGNNSHGGWMFLSRHDTTASRKWARYINTDYDATATDAALDTKGQVVVVGWRRFKPGGVVLPWMAKVATNSALVSSAKLPLPVEAAGITSIYAMADGGFVLATHWRKKWTDNFWTPSLTRLTASLTQIWQRDFRPQTTGSFALGSLVRAQGGGWRVAGSSTLTTSTGQVRSSLIVRTDDWGHSPCNVAGTCKGLHEKDCADGNKCTFDLCDPKKGCENPAISGCK